MNQNQFEHTHKESWHQFRQLLDALESTPARQKRSEIEQHEFPERYRRLCNHYSLAKTRHYRPALVDNLHDLVLRGHRQLYRKKTNLIWTLLNFIAGDFPRTVRQHHIVFWIACCLFFVPAATTGFATYNDPVLIYSIMEESQVVGMESMYNPEKRKIGRAAERDDETDITMFGYYILNNISIGFRTFAGGITFCVGTVFFLLFNGIMIGGVAGHLSHPPYSTTFWQFVCGHGAFELTAIVICGAAGLLLGYSLINPGQYRRRESLRMCAPIALKLVMGGALMLVVAAFIEAFWSSSSLQPIVKFWVGSFFWITVILYLFLAGRRRYES